MLLAYQPFLLTGDWPARVAFMPAVAISMLVDYSVSSKLIPGSNIWKIKVEEKAPSHRTYLNSKALLNAVRAREDAAVDSGDIT